jgi:hypothetical protein
MIERVYTCTSAVVTVHMTTVLSGKDILSNHGNYCDEVSYHSECPVRHEPSWEHVSYEGYSHHEEPYAYASTE